MEVPPPFGPQRPIRINRIGAAILAAGLVGLILDKISPKKGNIFNTIIGTIAFGAMSFAGLAGLGLTISFVIKHIDIALLIALLPVIDLSYYLYRRHIFGSNPSKAITALILGTILGTFITALVVGSTFILLRLLGYS